MCKKLVVFVVFVVWVGFAVQLLLAQQATTSATPQKKETTAETDTGQKAGSATSAKSAQPSKPAQVVPATPAPAAPPRTPPAPPKPVDYYEMLKSTEAFKRRVAVDNIGRKRNPADAPVLIEALSDSDPSVRIIACDCLGLMREQSATDKIITLLQDKEAQLRQSACVALGYIGDPKAIAPLIERIKTDTDTAVRTQAVLILGNMRAQQSVDTLVPLLKDTNLDIRLISVQALGKIGNNSAAPEIKNALNTAIEESKTEKEPYRQTQYNRLITESIKASGDLNDKSTEPLLLMLLQNDDKSIKITAATALGKIGNKSGLDVAKEFAADKDDMLRMQAVEALGFIGDASVVPMLEKIYNTDPNNNVKTTAEISLYKFGWRRPPPKPVKKEIKK
ncbi:MAG: HEAT repeat domain-containing protein [Elusimicrobiota bacterium]